MWPWKRSIRELVTIIIPSVMIIMIDLWFGIPNEYQATRYRLAGNRLESLATSVVRNAILIPASHYSSQFSPHPDIDNQFNIPLRRFS